MLELSELLNLFSKIDMRLPLSISTVDQQCPSLNEIMHLSMKSIQELTKGTPALNT